MGCPMTIAACEEYKITVEQQRRFCGKGCSMRCEKEFKKLCRQNQWRQEDGRSDSNNDYSGS